MPNQNKIDPYEGFFKIDFTDYGPYFKDSSLQEKIKEFEQEIVLNSIKEKLGDIQSDLLQIKIRLGIDDNSKILIFQDVRDYLKIFSV